MLFEVINRIPREQILVVPVGGEPYADKLLSALLSDENIQKSKCLKGGFCSAGVLQAEDLCLVLIDVGASSDSSPEGLRRIFGNLIREISFAYYQKMTVVIPKLKNIRIETTLESILEGLQLGSYSFAKYTGASANQKSAAEITVSLFVDSPEIPESLHAAARRSKLLCDGVILARDLINEPGNRLTPALFAERARREAQDVGIRAEIYDEKDLEAQNRIGILSVGKGSSRPPRLCVLKYAADPSAPLIALVGKGVTTDMGGMNLKIGPDLAAAKTDMGGAAAVLSVLRTAALLNLPCNLCGILPLAENICDGNALKPGEVLTYSDGTTVEIRNSDAEGRLILADGLILAREMKADVVIDIATLTGNCVQALGSKIAGIFGDDELAAQIIQSGAECSEYFWQMPLFEGYAEKLVSEVADLNNLAAEEPGAITAALFLKHFAGNAKWVHLDIAGTRNSSVTDGPIVKGGTGFGVKTLINFIEKRGHHEHTANS